jgi:hypothetical protein
MTPDDSLIGDLLPLLRAAEPGDWIVFAGDRDEQLPAAVRWLLADQASPLAGTPAHGRRPAIEWAAPGGWTTKTRQPPVRNGTGARIGRIRLRTPRPSTRKEP